MYVKYYTFNDLKYLIFQQLYANIASITAQLQQWNWKEITFYT